MERDEFAFESRDYTSGPRCTIGFFRVTLKFLFQVPLRFQCRYDETCTQLIVGQKKGCEMYNKNLREITFLFEFFFFVVIQLSLKPYIYICNFCIYNSVTYIVNHYFLSKKNTKLISNLYYCSICCYHN